MLTICGRQLNPRLIILDKDGTLIAFDQLWRHWYKLLLRELNSEKTMSASLSDALPASLGYDARTETWDPGGPLTLASTSELVVLLAGLLYAHEKLSWDAAIACVRKAEQRARAALPVDELVQPIGDVVGALTRWRAAGLQLALATTDERQLTTQTLAAVGLKGCFDAIICGDDGIPLKPAPDMALWLCDRLAIPPSETIVIGDTTADLAMAREAGAMAAVGVLSGAGTMANLARYTDLIIPDIHHVQIIASSKDERP